MEICCPILSIPRGWWTKGNFNQLKMRKEMFSNMAKSDPCVLWVYLAVVPASGALAYCWIVCLYLDNKSSFHKIPWCRSYYQDGFLVFSWYWKWKIPISRRKGYNQVLILFRVACFYVLCLNVLCWPWLQTGCCWEKWPSDLWRHHISWDLSVI